MDVHIKKEREGMVLEIIPQPSSVSVLDTPQDHLSDLQLSFPQNNIADLQNRYDGSSPYHVNYCGYEVCHSGYAFGPNSRTSYLLHIIFKGKGTYYVDNKVYHIASNQIFLIYPGVITTYQADFNDPWSYGWIGFSGYQSEFLLSQIGFSRSNHVISVPDTVPLHTCIQNIMKTQRITYSNELYRTAELLRFFALLIDSRPETKKALVYSKSAYAEVAMRYLTDNYMHKIKLSDLANSIGVDRSYLSKSFHENYHVSAQEFLMKLRMEKACHFLRDTEEPIASVATRVGYPDALAFSRIFKQRTGLSPSEYRKAEHIDVPVP